MGRITIPKVENPPRFQIVTIKVEIAGRDREHLPLKWDHLAVTTCRCSLSVAIASRFGPCFEEITAEKEEMGDMPSLSHQSDTQLNLGTIAIAVTAVPIDL